MTTATAPTATAPTPTECSRIEVGDDVVFLGQPHRITVIVPYATSFLGPVRVAHDAFGWAITLIDGQTLDVVRSPLLFSSRELSTARLSAPTRAGISLDSSLDVREPSTSRPIG